MQEWQYSKVHGQFSTGTVDVTIRAATHTTVTIYGWYSTLLQFFSIYCPINVSFTLPKFSSIVLLATYVHMQVNLHTAIILQTLYVIICKHNCYTCTYILPMYFHKLDCSFHIRLFVCNIIMVIKGLGAIGACTF